MPIISGGRPADSGVEGRISDGLWEGDWGGNYSQLGVLRVLVESDIVEMRFRN